jgi:hypothetical protein
VPFFPGLAPLIGLLMLVGERMLRLCSYTGIVHPASASAEVFLRSTP